MNLIKGKIFCSAFLNVIILTILLSGATMQCSAASRVSAIAVLPLQSELGAQKDYIGAAAGQILISRLAALGIRTVDPLTVRNALGKNHFDLSSLSSELGGACIVSGRVASAGEYMQIFLSLLCPQNGRTIKIHSRPIKEKQMPTELGSLADRIKLLTESVDITTGKADKSLSDNKQAKELARLKPESHADIRASAGSSHTKSENTEQKQHHQAQSNQDEYDEGDNLLPDYPVPVDEDIPQKAEVKDESGTAKKQSSQKNVADSEDRGASGLDNNGRSWLYWLMPWKSNHVKTGQKMTALTPKLPYPPPGVTDTRSGRSGDMGSDRVNPRDRQGASPDQGAVNSIPKDIPAEGPIWQWR